MADHEKYGTRPKSIEDIRNQYDKMIGLSPTVESLFGAFVDKDGATSPPKSTSEQTNDTSTPQS